MATADVIAGFERACDKALDILPELTCHTVKDFRNKEVCPGGALTLRRCLWMAAVPQRSSSPTLT